MKQTSLVRSQNFQRRLMLLVSAVLSTAASSLAAPHPPSAAPNPTVPFKINYQGTLQDAAGNPLPTGDYELSFSIYPTASGGARIWGPQRFNGQSGTGLGPRVPVVQGRFNVVLGEVDTSNRKLVDYFNTSATFLEITIGNNPPILPRQQILPSAYAFNAASLNGFTWEHLFTGGNPVTGALALGQDPSSVTNTDEGIFPPLDILGRPRIRQKAGGFDAGIWFRQSAPNSDRAFVGMNGDNAVGLFGRGFGWGISMNIDNGLVTIPAGLNIYGDSGAGLGLGEAGDTGLPIRIGVRCNWVGACLYPLVIDAPNDLEVNAALTTFSGQIRAAGFGPVSDRRLKKDIQTIKNPLSVLAGITGVRYRFDRDGNFARESGFELPAGEQVGVIAQDVERAIPEAVMRDQQGTLSVNYNGLTGVLIEAVKQQQREIEELRSELKAFREQKRP